MSKKRYGEHVVTLKSSIKRVLTCFNLVIPNSFTRLKRISGRETPFKGIVYICNSCGYGGMQALPTEKELESYYMEQYWDERTSSIADEEKEYLNHPRAIHQANFVFDEVCCSAITDILEIGAGPAMAVQLMRHKCDNNKINLHVCEPGVKWEDYYTKNNIKKVADFFPFETDVKFDYVHTSHWLEHVRDLGETLLALKKL